MRVAKFRRIDEGKKRRKKTYRQEKEAKESHLAPIKKKVEKTGVGPEK